MSDKTDDLLYRSLLELCCALVAERAHQYTGAIAFEDAYEWEMGPDILEFLRARNAAVLTNAPEPSEVDGLFGIKIRVREDHGVSVIRLTRIDIFERMKENE